MVRDVIGRRQKVINTDEDCYYDGRGFRHCD